MKFNCRCGNVLQGISDDTLHLRGTYMSELEEEAWLEEISQAIESFVKASCSGLRDQWFDESNKFFNSFYPRTEPDWCVIVDMIDNSRRSRSIRIYRCECCGTVYIQKTSGLGIYSDQFQEYQPVE